MSTDVESREASEFGAGIVVCLAKFSEHLWDDNYSRIRHIAWWADIDESERERQRAEADRFPSGDAARRLHDVSFAESVYGTHAEALSSQIMIWMNGASDHLYDLDESAPEPLKELAALTLRIGHGFTDERWTMEHVREINRLWKESCLAIDRMLGVTPDWGQW